MPQGEGGLRTLRAAAGKDPQLRELPGAGGAALGAQHQRLDISIKQLALALAQCLEFLEHLAESGRVELESQGLNARAQRLGAALPAQHQGVFTDHCFVARDEHAR